MTQPIRGVLFDKDGTLFDFSATWDAWASRVIHELSMGQEQVARAIAGATRYDLSTGKFHADSPIIAGTNREAAELVASALPGTDIADLEVYLSRTASEAPLVPSVPLEPLLAGLRGRGLGLGVMTNDSEVSARAHLAAAGVANLFHFVAGFDSGHGAKPSPKPLLAFAAHLGLLPDEVVMVGDSTHDLLAGRAAGMSCVGVLTGPARREDLMPYADVVLPDIGHLPGWLAERPHKTT